MPAPRSSRPGSPSKKRHRPADEAAETTLDAKRKAVAAEQAKILAQQALCQKLIEEAPRKAAELKRRQRDEYVTRVSSLNSVGPRTALPDRRYDLNAGTLPRQRRLRAERNRGRLMFFVLLIIFAAVIGWLYFTMLKGG